MFYYLYNKLNIYAKNEAKTCEYMFEKKRSLHYLNECLQFKDFCSFIKREQSGDFEKNDLPLCHIGFK